MIIQLDRDTEMWGLVYGMYCALIDIKPSEEGYGCNVHLQRFEQIVTEVAAAKPR
jgi:hypothetical protein